MIYCSLGGICHSSQLLKINGVKKSSYPFDWIFSNIPMVKHCIEDNFKSFLDKSQYSDYEINNTLIENKCEHSFYGEIVFKGQHKVIFNHHNPLSKQEDYHYFERCVNRFRELLISDEPKTFIIFCGVDSYEFSELFEFNDFIRKHTNNYTLLVIQNEVSDKNSHILYDRIGSELRILRIETKSSTNGVDFKDKSDEEYLNETLKLYEII